MASAEVRQCSKCQAQAVVEVFRWEHEGLNDATIEYRCQACGAWHVRAAKYRTLALWIVGGVFTVTTCVFGLPLLAWAWWRQSFDKRVPIVPGVAPPPSIRFPGGPPKRTCAKCGGMALPMNIVRHTHRGVPTGDEYEYLCVGCGLKFETENTLGSVTSALGVAVLQAISAAFYFSAESAGWKWSGTLGCGALSGFLAWQLIERVMNRVKHRAV